MIAIAGKEIQTDEGFAGVEYGFTEAEPKGLGDVGASQLSQ